MLSNNFASTIDMCNKWFGSDFMGQIRQRPDSLHVFLHVVFVFERTALS